MDFDQLTTFVQVAKLGSFSRAGQKVFRSQSAVSAQIRQLEQTYGSRLLDRTAKSVHLTPAGEVLFEYAERLLRLRVSTFCLTSLPNFSAAIRLSRSVSTGTLATRSCNAWRTAQSMSAS